MESANRKDFGLLALRLGVGSVLIAHGGQKLFGWFGGGGLGAAAGGMEQMGFRPGKPAALASGLCETGGGTLLALGLATPAAGAAAAGGMAGAVAVHAPAGFFAASGGFEHPALVGWTAACLGLAGPGRISLDHLTGHCLDRSWVITAAFGAAALAAASIVTTRNRAMAANARRAAEDAT